MQSQKKITTIKDCSFFLIVFANKSSNFDLYMFCKIYALCTFLNLSYYPTKLW